MIKEQTEQVARQIVEYLTQTEHLKNFRVDIIDCIYEETDDYVDDEAKDEIFNGDILPIHITLYDKLDISHIKELGGKICKHTFCDGFLYDRDDYDNFVLHSFYVIHS